MPTECFHCGDDDHLSYDCPRHTRPRPAPEPAPWPPAARPTWTPPPFTAPVYEAAPPSTEYRQALADLGIHSNPDDLLSRCPWCGASPMRACVNRSLNRTVPPHEARIAFPLLREDWPPYEPQRVLAAQQIAESRAARFDSPVA